MLLLPEDISEVGCADEGSAFFANDGEDIRGLREAKEESKGEKAVSLVAAITELGL